jgi:hypothetical protein
MLFAQHRLAQPKLFGSDHGLRFVSGPQIRAPCSLNLIFRRDRKELFVGGLGICLLNSSIHRTMADDTLLIELTGIPHVIALVCGVFLRRRVQGDHVPRCRPLAPLTVASGCTVANHHSSILLRLPFNEKAGRPKMVPPSNYYYLPILLSLFLLPSVCPLLPVTCLLLAISRHHR